jgi:hypothetical protein
MLKWQCGDFLHLALGQMGSYIQVILFRTFRSEVLEELEAIEVR